MITDCLLSYNFIHNTKQRQSTAFMDTSQGATQPRLDSLPLVSQIPSSQLDSLIASAVPLAVVRAAVAIVGTLSFPWRARSDRRRRHRRLCCGRSNRSWRTWCHWCRCCWCIGITNTVAWITSSTQPRAAI